MLGFWKGDAALTLDNSSDVFFSMPWRNASSGNGLCFLSDSNAAVREFGTNLLQEADLQQCALSVAGTVLERQNREVQMRAASVDVPCGRQIRGCCGLKILCQMVCQAMLGP